MKNNTFITWAYHKHVPVILLSLLLFYQFFCFRFEFVKWDMLLITGLITYILGCNLAAGLKLRFEFTIKRLLIRKVITTKGKDNSVLGKFDKHAQKVSWVFSIVVAIFLFVAFSIVLFKNFSWQWVILGIIETYFGYIGGAYVGRMISYGRLGWQLRKDESITIEVKPLHVDGVAGLKPVGDFFFYQATIAAIPAIFLGVWWLLFPIWPRDYSVWENSYLLLLAFAILIEVAAFLVPIWSFHQIMTSAKEEKLLKADEKGTQINEIQSVSDSNQSREIHNLSDKEIDRLRSQYWSIENMPTWPVDIKTRSRFKINNIMLFIPLFGDIAKRSIDWKHIVSFLKQFGT